MFAHRRHDSSEGAVTRTSYPSLKSATVLRKISNMEATPRTTEVTTTGGIWMMEASPEASSAAPSRTTSSSGLEQTTSSPSIPPILESSSGGPSAGLVAGCVVGVLALILLAAGAAFIILKKRGIIFKNDDAAPSTKRADPEGSTFSNLLGEKSAGTSREGPPPLPTSGPPVTPGRKRRPARKQEDPLPIPDNDTYANLLEEPREAPIHKRNQRDPLPTPDDNTYIDLLQETPTHNRSQERPLPTNEYIDLPQGTPTNNRNQGDPLPPLDDNTYMDLLEETRERPDNNTYTSLLDEKRGRPDIHTGHLNQRNQPDGAERTYQNVNVPGRAHRVPYVNVTELRPSPRAQQIETADGLYEMADPGGVSAYENCSPAEYVNNCSPVQYENCSPAQYVNAGAGGNIAETSFMTRENADNLYEDVQPENEPTYANQ
ncbi:uncharacterized protein LOC144918462 [Branchiostoma floridae x Branchiostoma belcheri]